MKIQQLACLAGSALLAAAAWGAPSAEAPAEIRLVAPAQDAIVPLLRPGHKEFLGLGRDERRARFADVDGYRAEMLKTGTTPASVRLRWDWTPATSGKKPKPFPKFVVTILRADDGSVAQVHLVKTNALKVTNLEIATRYRWRVALSGPRGAELSPQEGAFATESDAPRWIKMEGVANVRDLGGRIGRDGRRVKQGLVYRSQGLNKNAKPNEQKLGRARGTPESRRRVLAELGIKTDLDLRRDDETWGMTGSPLGPSVRWVHVSHSSYGGMGKPQGRAAFARAFRVFLDPANYPIVFHCIGGADRTGALGFILNALLGVDEDELWKDWEATGFCYRAKVFTHKESFDKLVAVFMREAGDTMNARVENYVLSCGVTREEIDRFRAIMFGDTPILQLKPDLYTAFNAASSAQRRAMMLDSATREAMAKVGTPPPTAPKDGVPRWYDGHGIKNLRDLGGWTGLDGKKIRTGRIFRSAATETVKDAAAFQAALHVKTEIDLRTPKDVARATGGKSPLGSNVNYLERSAPNYASMRHKDEMRYFADFFRLFLDEANYPILFHCAKGADRTGTMAFLLDGLLGVDEDSLAKDWQMTAFYNPNPLFRDPERYDALVDKVIVPCPGDTWTAKFESYARACGITDAEIARFRTLMLEEKKGTKK